MSTRELSRLGFAALLVERAEASRRLSEIDAALATAYAQPDGVEVFTSRDGERPSRTSRRAFRERCAKIHTARREGKIWIVSRVDWFAATQTRRDRSPMVAPLDNVDELLAAAGIRPTARRVA